MCRFVTIFVIALGFILASSAANAFDYKNWVPLLPENIGKMIKQGDPEGMNIEKGGQAWSSLRQKYSDTNGNNIRLSIVSGTNAPGIREFKTMQQFNMETQERKVKTQDVEGYKAVLDFNKMGGKSHLLIAVQDETLVIIETTSFDSENDLVSLADDIPLSEIADSINH